MLIAPRHCGSVWQEFHCPLPPSSAAVCSRGSTPLGSGQCISCRRLPHCLGAVGSGQWNSCNTLLHCPGLVGSGTLAIHRHTACVGSGPWISSNTLPRCLGAVGVGQWTSANTLPNCLGAAGSGTPATQCHTTQVAVGGGSPAEHGHTAWGQWTVEILQYTAKLPEAVDR